MSAARIPVIGIIGGIGSGKTALANAMCQTLAVRKIDADLIGHEILRRAGIKSALQHAFGAGIFDPAGEVQRSALAAVVFGNDEEKINNRKKLEAIVHPEIRKTIHQQLELAQDQSSIDVIILDAALLLEGGWEQSCDAIVYLDVPEPVRLQRVQARGWTAEQFRDREGSQLPLREKKQRADIQINNNRPIEEVVQDLITQLQQLFPQLNKQPSLNTTP